MLSDTNFQITPCVRKTFSVNWLGGVSNEAGGLWGLALGRVHRYHCIGLRGTLGAVVTAGCNYGVGVLAHLRVVWDNSFAPRNPAGT